MSRRYSSRTRVQPHPWDDLQQAHWSEVSWWYDEIPGFEPHTWSEWQDAWAEVTMRVVRSVWSRQGSRLYAAHRNHALREDLQNWLTIQAQELASRFIPSPWHPEPHAQWGAYLRKALDDHAQYHFSRVVGDSRLSKGQAAIKAHNRGIASTEHLDDMFAEDGRSIARHALHGHSYGTEDPLSVIIRLEGLLDSLSDAEHRMRQDGYSTSTTVSASGVCLENLCTKEVYGQGLCETHWRREWQLQSNLANPCTIPGCGETHRGHGFCGKHLELHRRGSLDPQWHHLYQPSRKPGRVPEYDNTTCLEEGCDLNVRAKGRCENHYAAYRRKNKPPCTIDGCGKPYHARKMCHSHYAQWLQENGAALNKKGGAQ